MSSYSKNIARLKSTSRANLQFSSQDRLNAARTAGLAQEREAEKIARSLSEFSGHLKQYSKDLIEKRTEEGILEARRVATEKAKERTILEKEAAQIEEAQKEIGQTTEGLKTLRVVWKKAKEEGIEMPIVNSLYKIIYGKESLEGSIEKVLGTDQPKDVEFSR